MLIDPYNNVGRRCDVVGIKTETPREFWVEAYVGRSIEKESLYRVRNTETGDIWIIGVRSMTNLY